MATKGYECTLSLDTVTIGRGRGVTATGDRGEHDDTTRDSGDHTESSPGRKSMTTEVEALFVGNNTGNAAILAAWVNGTLLDIIQTDAEGFGFSGTCWVKTIRIGEPADASKSLGCTLRWTGDISLVAPGS